MKAILEELKEIFNVLGYKSYNYKKKSLVLFESQTNTINVKTITISVKREFRNNKVFRYYSLVFSNFSVNLGSFYLFANEFQREILKKINLSLVKLHIKNKEFNLYSKEPKYILKILKNEKIVRDFLLLVKYILYFEWNLGKKQFIFKISKHPEIVPMVIEFVEILNKLTQVIANTEIDLKLILVKKSDEFLDLITKSSKDFVKNKELYIRSLRCPHCDKNVTEFESNCLHCEKEIRWCMICWNTISTHILLAQYDCCKSWVHYEHAKSWSKFNNTCPNCFEVNPSLLHPLNSEQ